MKKKVGRPTIAPEDRKSKTLSARVLKSVYDHAKDLADAMFNGDMSIAISYAIEHTYYESGLDGDGDLM